MDREKIIENMQELINNIPTNYYADVLFHSMSSIIINKTRSGENVNANLKTRGIVFRIFNGERFYEISTPSTGMHKMHEKVAKLLQNLEKKDNIDLYKYPKHSINSVIPMENNFTKISLAEKLKKIKDLFDNLKKINNNVKNAIIQYKDTIQERIFLNTEGSVLRQVIPRMYTYIAPIVKIDGKIDSDNQLISGEGGYDILSIINLDFLTKLVSSSIELAKASLAPTGIMPIVLDPSISGFLAHNIFGHGVQGDSICSNRSVWKDYLNKRVGSEIINISDNSISGLYGNYYFDDEGVILKKTPIIENGYLNHYLHSRMTANILGLEGELRGNGRRESFMHRIYARNSNTFFEPGDFNLNEIIADIKHGILIEKANHGMEDFQGSININSKSGHIIDGGQIKERVKGISLTGNAFDLLNNINAISNDPIQHFGMESRKGNSDTIPISYGGVYVKSQKGFVSPG